MKQDQKVSRFDTLEAIKIFIIRLTQLVLCIFHVWLILQAWLIQIQISRSTEKAEFQSWFADFTAHELDFKLFASPFSINPNSPPESMQMELIELQCNSELERKFCEVPLIQFYKLYISHESYPSFRSHALKMVALFPSTYIGEQFFSKMKQKTKFKKQMQTNRWNLSNELRIASTNIKANIPDLCREMKCQISH